MTETGKDIQYIVIIKSFFLIYSSVNNLMVTVCFTLKHDSQASHGLTIEFKHETVTIQY